ncbi:hypothetical protein HPP92_005981 [Vanilla planifolia]|uniref:Uncharacterized protein n=1 Tax=Vanilla planifolia TaxID=51239 RepID=A0A835RL90_VANPL|nr:hypothetical protein HPP92_005981 [Vanilla planifolia]
MVHEAHDRYTLRLPDNVRKDHRRRDDAEANFAVTGSVGVVRGRFLEESARQAAAAAERFSSGDQIGGLRSSYDLSVGEDPCGGPSRGRGEGTTVKVVLSKSGKDWFREPRGLWWLRVAGLKWSLRSFLEKRTAAMDLYA